MHFPPQFNFLTVEHLLEKGKSVRIAPDEPDATAIFLFVFALEMISDADCTKQITSSEFETSPLEYLSYRAVKQCLYDPRVHSVLFHDSKHSQGIYVAPGKDFSIVFGSADFVRKACPFGPEESLRVFECILECDPEGQYYRDLWTYYQPVLI